MGTKGCYRCKSWALVDGVVSLFRIVVTLVVGDAAAVATMTVTAIVTKVVDEKDHLNLWSKVDDNYLTSVLPSELSRRSLTEGGRQASPSQKGINRI